MYAVGNTGRITGDAANPQDRCGAMGGAETISQNGWRVWMEHQGTGKRIYESPAEIEHRRTEESERMLRLAENHIPGFISR